MRPGSVCRHLKIAGSHFATLSRHQPATLKVATHPSKISPPAKDATPQAKTFPVVAIAVATAGGLEAYKIFFHALPADTGMVFVLIQHLDPSHQSLLAEILSIAIRMPVDGHHRPD